jgi:hypothetical protein
MVVEEVFDVIIDSHIHITEDGKWCNTDIDASLDRLLREMDVSSVEKCVLLPIYGIIPNEFVAKVCRDYPDRFIGFASVDPLEGENAICELERAVSEYGLSGLKFHPRLQGFAPNDERLFPLLEKAIELDIPVLFDTYFQSEKVLLKELGPFQYDILAKRYPEAKIILAHAGAHKVMDAYFVAKANRNVYLEVSHIFSYFKGTSVIDDVLFVCDRLDKKVIYGSDFPEVSIDGYYRELSSFLSKISTCDSEAIFGGNLERILRS